MPRRERFTPTQVAEALRQTRGMVYLAAEVLQCHHSTVYDYIERHPSVKDASQFESGKMLDAAELKLAEAIMDGQAWAVCFYLKTKGKERGYVERTEQANEGTLEIIHRYGSGNREGPQGTDNAG